VDEVQAVENLLKTLHKQDGFTCGLFQAGSVCVKCLQTNGI